MEELSASDICSQWDAHSRSWRFRILAKILDDVENSKKSCTSKSCSVIDDRVFGCLLFARILSAMRVSHAQQYSVRKELAVIACFLESASNYVYLRQFAASGGFESVLLVLTKKLNIDAQKRYDIDCSNALKLLYICVNSKDICKRTICEANGIDAILHCLMQTEEEQVLRLACILLVALAKDAQTGLVRNCILALLSHGTEYTVEAAFRIAAEMNSRSGLNGHADCLVMPAINALRMCRANTLIFAEDLLVSLIPKCRSKWGAIISLLRLMRGPNTAALPREVALGVLDQLVRLDQDCLLLCSQPHVLYLLFRVLIPRQQMLDEVFPHRIVNNMQRIARILCNLYLHAKNLSLKDTTFCVQFETLKDFYSNIVKDRVGLELLLLDPNIFVSTLVGNTAAFEEMKCRLGETKATIVVDKAFEVASLSDFHDALSLQTDSVNCQTMRSSFATSDVWNQPGDSVNCETMRSSLATPDVWNQPGVHEDKSLESIRTIKTRPAERRSATKNGLDTPTWRKIRRLKINRRPMKTKNAEWNRPEPKSTETETADYKVHMERIILSSLQKYAETPTARPQRRGAKNDAEKQLQSDLLPQIITKAVNFAKNKEHREAFYM